MIAATYKFSDNFGIRAGYRILEGGADNDEVYNFALFHYAFTDSTFNGLVTPQGVTLGPRSYNSFLQAGEEAGWSRLYGGIHYRKSIEVGFLQGRKVADNIVGMLKFLK